MIRYTCDCCGCDLDAKSDLRYVVKIEIYAAFDPTTVDEEEHDRDHLEELQEILERIDDVNDPSLSEDVYEQRRFDLCPECRKRFLKNPMGRETAKAFGFSSN